MTDRITVRIGDSEIIGKIIYAGPDLSTSNNKTVPPDPVNPIIRQ